MVRIFFKILFLDSDFDVFVEKEYMCVLYAGSIKKIQTVAHCDVLEIFRCTVDLYCR